MKRENELQFCRVTGGSLWSRLTAVSDWPCHFPNSPWQVTVCCFFFNLNCLFLMSFSLLFWMVDGISSCFLFSLLSYSQTLVYSYPVGGGQTYFRQVLYHWYSPTHPVLETQVSLLCPDPLRKCLLQANTDDLLELCFFRKASWVWAGYTEEGALVCVCRQARESSLEQWCLNEVRRWAGVCGRVY